MLSEFRSSLSLATCAEVCMLHMNGSQIFVSKCIVFLLPVYRQSLANTVVVPSSARHQLYIRVIPLGVERSCRKLINMNTAGCETKPTTHSGTWRTHSFVPRPRPPTWHGKTLGVRLKYTHPSLFILLGNCPHPIFPLFERPADAGDGRLCVEVYIRR